LTMIGIFIGIAAVVSLVSLGEGLQGAIQNEFEALGSDKLIIMPQGAIFGAGGVDALTDDDIVLVRKMKNIESAVGYMFTTAKIEWDDELRYQVVMGLPDDDESYELFSSFDYTIMKGRSFRSGEKYKAIVGYDYATHPAFDSHLDIGEKVTINDQVFEVIGIWNKVGNSQDDRSITIPINTARDLFGIPDRIDSILAQVKPGLDPARVALDVEDEMRKDRDQKEGEEDFAVQSLLDVMKSFLVIIDIVTFVLGGIAFISLLVGSIGIMNTMYTAVLERTKEIGIMKAIGARNSDVLSLFLIESGLLGIAGGIIGIILGGGLSSAIAYLAQTIGGFKYLEAHFPWWLIIGALAVSFFVGMLAGILPARQAARKSPVDALRYE